ncbi:MAG: hypothetical protein EHM33_00950 [Chloroflexi bacterium]|nr:MAG: hypothetical protein EHM33_00950 [Chloroflexota bacterium]
MTTVVISEAVKTYLKTYSGIGSSAVVLVDYLSGNPSEYAVSQQPGTVVLETYLTGATERQFNFALQMMAYTADDAARIANSGFFEGVAAWLESQSEAGTFPTLNTNQHPTDIRATGQPFLYQQGESETAIYQMNCALLYDQDAP